MELSFVLSLSIFLCHFFLTFSCSPLCVFQFNTLSLIQSFHSALLYTFFVPPGLHLSLFYTFFLCFSEIFLRSVCLPVSLPGVAHVKLTTPDKDNSLTHSVVYFSPLLFPLFHSIPHSSLIHPVVQPCLMVFSFRLLLSICFTPPVFSSGGQPILPSYLFIVSSAVSLLPSAQHQSIHLSFWLSLHLCLPLNGSICLSMHPYVPLTVLFSLLLNLFNPVSTPPHLRQIIRLTPSFHSFIPSSLNHPFLLSSSCLSHCVMHCEH